MKNEFNFYFTYLDETGDWGVKNIQGKDTWFHANEHGERSRGESLNI